MADYSILKGVIANAIYANGNNEITGDILQYVLLSMVNSLGNGYQYKGAATPSTNPGTPDQNVFYIASEPGTYANFSNLIVGNNEVAILKYNGTWTKETTGAASTSAINSIDLIKKAGAVALEANTDLNNLGFGIYSFTAAVSETLVHSPRTGGGYIIVEKTTPANDVFKRQTIMFASAGETYVRFNNGAWARIDVEVPNYTSAIFPYTIYFAGRTYLYIEETGSASGGIYIKPVDESMAFNVYGIGGTLIYTVANWAAFASALSKTLSTSPKGVQNCLQIVQHESLVFDTNAKIINIKTKDTILATDVLLVRNVAGRCLYVRQELLNIIDLNERFEAIETAIGQIEHELPEYWENYMATKLGAINGRCWEIGLTGDNFVFITDIHNEGNAGNSPKLIKKILENTPVRNVIIGGDLLSSATTRDDACNKIQELRNKYNFTDRVFPVRGNHDVNIDTDTAITGGDYYSIMERPLENIIDTGRELYYYRDNEAQKIRYIFIDAYGGTDSAIESAQENWIKTRVRELQSGWGVVFFAHPYWHVSTTSSVSVLAIGTYLKGLINDLITGAGGSTPIDAKVIALIVGHVHRDMIEFVNVSTQKYWIIGTTCDKGGTNNFDPEHSARTFGTIHEHAFDVYNLNTNKGNINITRIGEGGDRLIHGTTYIVNVGNTFTISSQLSGTLTWHTNDSSIVTVTSGIVTGVNQGTTFVWAEDENGNKEYFISQCQ